MCIYCISNIYFNWMCIQINVERYTRWYKFIKNLHDSCSEWLIHQFNVRVHTKYKNHTFKNRNFICYRIFKNDALTWFNLIENHKTLWWWCIFTIFLFIDLYMFVGTCAMIMFTIKIQINKQTGYNIRTVYGEYNHD